MRRGLMVVLITCWAAGAWAAATNTNLVAFALLKATPEKFRSKKVAYEERFTMFLTSMPEYMVRSGIKEDSHFLLVVGDPQLPVIIRKNAKVNETVSGLKAGAIVKVSGRVREFDVDPRRGMMPRYYVDADEVVYVKEGAPDAGNRPNPGERQGNPFQQGPRGRGRGADRP